MCWIGHCHRLNRRGGMMTMTMVGNNDGDGGKMVVVALVVVVRIGCSWKR